ncbi:DUF1178 family protein [Stappia sp. ES.058]|uniref:DUF1178 family protein n=1 Tax=Stappia sp. ES.058 TaxID=1881061 RepID=UPI00087D6D91|nr:DUF1178 family protein [Stappia sp. ES.058]SDU37679.1 hypothetical protein SAMN05428979_3326 [Stappia sp. ES.058]
MIRYQLRCTDGHGFEAWFRGSDDFEAQKARDLVSCPSCGSTRVEKALMAPAVSTARSRLERPDPPAVQGGADSATDKAGVSAAGLPAAQEAQAASPAPVASESGGRVAEIVEKLRALRTELMAKGENVGSAFPEEARKIHYGETEERGIYGAATREEVGELIDEGIAVLPLPVLPEDRN